MSATLSCCLIVKNEEAQLPRCLASVADQVDEIVVVDTGSTDRTVAVAEQFGARVFHHPWDGSFSSARNVSLDHASGDWVLVLDADEALTRGALLRQAVDQAGPKVEAFTLPLVNFIGERDHEAAVRAPSLRVFRNRPEHRYSRALHEQILGTILDHRPEAELPFLDAPIEHYGYLDQVVRERGKVERNLALAQAEVERHPNDAFTWYNLAQEHFRRAAFDEALRAYQEAFPKLDSLAAVYASALLKNLVICLLQLGRCDESLAILADAQEAYPGFTDLWVLEGQTRLRQGRFEEAADGFRAALQKGDPSAAVFMADEGVGSYKAYCWLGTCCSALGRLDEARDAYLAALDDVVARRRYLVQPLDGLLQTLTAEHQPPEGILALLAEHADLGDPRWRELVGWRLLTTGIVEPALELLADCATLQPDTLLARGLALLRRGDYKGALRDWARVPDDCHLRLVADCHTLLGHVLDGRLEAARELYGERLVSRAEVELASLYAALLDSWEGRPVEPPAVRASADELRGYVVEVLELMLTTGSYALFERTLPALDWLGVPPAEQAAAVGDLYSRAGLTDMALEALLLALEGGDERTETYRSAGLVCLRKGLYVEAEQLLGEVLRRQEREGVAWSPTNAVLLGYLSALTAQGKTSEAEPLWQRLLSAPTAASEAGPGQAAAM